MSELLIEPAMGRALEEALGDLARLRISVFRAFPYLYDGDAAYEERYLRAFAAEPEAMAVLVRDPNAGHAIVGASTCAPLASQEDAFREPFAAHGFDPSAVCYFGESVLLDTYRGRGIGHAFFDLREAHAAHLGLSVTGFCAVERPSDDPRRPADYRPLEPFWRARGYAPVAGMTTLYSWPDLGEAEKSAKTMQFWIRRAEV